MKTDVLKKIIKASVVLIILILIYIAFQIRAIMAPHMVGGDFSANFNGDSWTYSQNTNKVNLFYIGYVNCPDICPITLSSVNVAYNKLTEEEKKLVNVIFLSVDHQNDTPEEVAEYTAQFSPNFVGLSGTKEEIDKIVELFQASYIVEKDEKSYLGYSILHTDRLWFLDNDGKAKDVILNPRLSDEILLKIKGLL